MARKQGFLAADFSKQFDESYAALQHQQQSGADKVILALLKGQPTPGMRSSRSSVRSGHTGIG